MTRRMALLLIPILLTGCFARGFDRADLYSRLKVDQGQLEVNDTDIVKAQSAKPQLTLPCRVAVYLPPRTDRHSRVKEKEAIDRWAETLKKEGVVSDMFVMSDLMTTGTTLKELRVAAARHGANLLLVMQGESDVDNYKNPAAVFNLTIVGGFIVPASHCERAGRAARGARRRGQRLPLCLGRCRRRGKDHPADISDRRQARDRARQGNCPGELRQGAS